MRCLIITLGICIFLCCGCSGNEETGEINFFGGEGVIHMVDSHNLPHVYYDDNYEYVITYYTGVSSVDKDGNVYSICDDASCEHDNEKCKANYLEHLYFVMDDELYEIKDILDGEITKSIIKKVNDTEVKFMASYPEEMDITGKNYNLQITNAYLINNTYLYVNCGGYAYLLDKEFNMVLWWENTGKEDWCMIKDDILYYVSDLYEINMIDMDTKVETVFEMEDYVLYADNDDEYIYYVNDTKRLCKVSITNGEREVLYKGVFDFVLGSKYLYFTPVSLNKDPVESAIITMDKSGNIVNKIDNIGDKYTSDLIREVNGKIIVTCSSSILVFELDGSNPTEYAIER